MQTITLPKTIIARRKKVSDPRHGPLYVTAREVVVVLRDDLFDAGLGKHASFWLALLSSAVA